MMPRAGLQSIGLYGHTSRRLLPGKPIHLSHRALSRDASPITSSAHPHGRSTKRRLIGFGSACAGVVGIVAFSNATLDDSKPRPLSTLTWRELGRRYFVYTCCSTPKLIEWSPKIMEWCQHTFLPGANKAFEWVATKTFFAQFVGGETAEDCMEIIRRIAEESVGAILAYSVEVDESKATILTRDRAHDHDHDYGKLFLHEDKVAEIMHSIQVAAKLNEGDHEVEKMPCRNDSVLVAVKLSGLLQDASVLERASACIMPREEFANPPDTQPPKDVAAVGACPGLFIPTSSLSDSDVGALKALWDAMKRIAACAEENGRVRILLDAEYSWYQPAIDAFFESCASQFNRLPTPRRRWLPWRKTEAPSGHVHLPIIYNTYQAYLRRTPAYLSMSLERARLGGYALGVKLVRGAYVEIENKLWQDTIVDTPPAMLTDAHSNKWKSPVWPTKKLTDECYDWCVEGLVKRIKDDMDVNGPGSAARLAVVFAGHNWDSSLGVIQHMESLQLATRPTTTNGSSPLQLAQGVRGRIHLGQLYGMANDLTHTITQAFDPRSGGNGPFIALSYIPYGDVGLVMPYLTRRASENKAVMGAGRGARERSLVIDEIRQRLRHQTRLWDHAQRTLAS